MTASHSPDHPIGAQDADVKALRRDVEDMADVAVERGRGFAAAARVHAMDYAEGRKGDAAKSVSDLAGTLRDSGKTFDDRPNIKAFFASAADGLEDLAGSIDRRSFADFYDDAERYARRSPVTVAVATFAAGFLLSRFVKASGSRVIDDTYDRYRA